MSKPLCLVTGACGFLGSHMLELLCERGYPVRATDLASQCEANDLETSAARRIIRRLGVELVVADLGDPTSLGPVVRDVRLCFHTAGARRPPSSSRRDAERLVYDSTRALLERLLDQPSFSKLVHWSSCAGYAPWAPLPLTEESPWEPRGHWLTAVTMGERLLAEYGADRGLRYSVLRPSGVYGPRGRRDVGWLLGVLSSAPVLLCSRSWRNRLGLVHVRDLCAAALFLAEEPTSDGETYNLDDGGALEVAELVRLVGEILGKPIVPLPPVTPVAPVTPVSTPGVRAAILAAVRGMAWLGVDSSKLLEDLSWALDLRLDRVFDNSKILDTGFLFTYPESRQGLADTLLWYQRGGGLLRPRRKEGSP